MHIKPRSEHVSNHSFFSPSSPFSVNTAHKCKLAEDGQESTTQKRLVLENGHPGVAINEAAIRRGEDPYAKYYAEQGEDPTTIAAAIGAAAAAGAGAGAGAGHHPHHL